MNRLVSGGILAGMVLGFGSPVLAEEASSANQASATAEPPPQMVPLAPAPGVRISVPKGWIACDDPTNKLLGGADDSLGLKTQFCSGSTHTLRVFNPALFRTASVTLDYQEKQEIKPDEIAALTPEIFKAIAPEACKAATEPLTSEGDQIDSCECNLGELAGHRSLITHLLATPKAGTRLQQFEITMYELPYAKGYLTVQFNTPVLLKSATSPLLDMIRASVVVE